MLDSPNHLLTLLNILGSLAIFLYAMKLLGNSLQNIIGDKIEYILKKLTDRSYKGMLVGASVTFLTQSSSITVLTLIGLVNIGALNLNQGVGIILGSEIGTTITAQLVAFDIHWFFFPLLALGFSLFTFSSNKKLNSLGKVLFSFGLLFMGIEMMKKGASPLKQSPLALSLFESFGKNLFLGIIAGALFTAITSSSSATTSLVVALGASNTITLPAGIALILGANIGTCFLEVIAVMNMSLTAKRVATAQAIINLLGVAIIFPFIRPFANLMSFSAPHLSRQIANSHTVFNVASSLVFLFFVSLIVSLAKKIVPGDTVKIKRGTKYIDPKILGMPHIALVNATKEVKRAGEITLSMFNCIKKTLLENRDDLIETIYAQENQMDYLNESISRYLALISEHELDAHSSEKIAQLFHGISDIERASDHLNRVAEQIELKLKKKITFSRPQQKEIANFSDECAHLFKKSLDIFISTKPDQAPQVFDQWQAIRSKQKKMALKSAQWSQEKRKIYTQILHQLERIANHANNIAQIAVSGF